MRYACAIRELFKVSRYRPARGGILHIADGTAGGSPKPSDAERAGSSRSGGRGGRAGGIYALFVDDQGYPGEEVHADVDPDVIWISVKDGTRTPDLLNSHYLGDCSLFFERAESRAE